MWIVCGLEISKFPKQLIMMIIRLMGNLRLLLLLLLLRITVVVLLLLIGLLIGLLLGFAAASRRRFLVSGFGASENGLLLHRVGQLVDRVLDCAGQQLQPRAGGGLLCNASFNSVRLKLHFRQTDRMSNTILC